MSRSPRRPPAEPAAAPARRPPGLPLVVLATLAVLVTAADTYVVVLALPDILTGVGVGLDELQRATPIIGGFLLGYTATLPLLGRLADLRGRVPVLVGCLLLFAFGSLLTATADSLGPAVLGRGLQGIGAGGLVPATLALVADRWPPERRSLPLGVVGRGAGGRRRARSAGRRGGPGRRRLAGDLLAQPAARTGPGGRRRGGRRGSGVPTRVGLALAVVAAARAGAPARRTGGAGRGRHPRPALRPARAVAVGSPRRWSLVAVLAGAGLVARSLARPEGAVLPLRGLRRLAARGRRARAPRWRSWPSAAWSGPSPPPTRRPRSWRTAPVLLPAGRSWPASPSSCTSGGRPIRCCRSRALRPVGAWGALVVNLLVGAALVAALVDVPLFARNTTTPGDQLGAALVLLRLLVAVPVGAVAGGWLCRTVAPRGSSRRAAWRWRRSPSWP